MSFHDPKKLSPMTTQWHNRSHSSIISDAATFHSAHATHAGTHIELETQKPFVLKQDSSREPTHVSVKMDRTDSGFEEGSTRSSTEGRRKSTSSRHQSPRTSTSGTRPRPQQRRNPRSTPSNSSNPPRRSTSEWRAGAPRPSLHARHTTPYRTSTQYPNAYFHFPPIALTDENEETNPAPPSPPPPATVQYWTSDSTRRLEYAAIDAASKGVRGFVIKLVPDCFLPKSTKRNRFHCEDANSDAGSVRRYRLNLPEENLGKELQDVHVKEASQKRPLFRRWTTLGGKKKA
ncbi:hypothetical protein PVAG01_03482 [Phlyctema vagabunda]|uniref:Uncharacterized protein n=1 Tax=Phlyctema vagabunda TaxID=108571 RepID=A0ABR4PLI0_9HELO